MYFVLVLKGVYVNDAVMQKLGSMLRIIFYGRVVLIR
jgi:hypothetical protein